MSGKRGANRRAGGDIPPGDRPAEAFAPTVGALDLHLFNEGRHRRLGEVLGAHCREVDGVAGVAFAVWAPNAERVSVVGDFNGWNGDRHPLRPLGGSGVHERFIPELGPGTLYKFEIRTADGALLLKTDPCGGYTEQPPGHASIVVAPEPYPWGDAAWLETRAAADPLRSPLSVYEVHLGSWIRADDGRGRSLSYREIAPRLAEHVAGLGFTHVELMPIMEHPFGGSWGYQVTGYFAPCSRYGPPDDLRFLIDTLHQAGLGVLLDWVPAHFPGDEHGLARFDGTALYEHADPRQGRHPDWDTCVFNYERHEVRSFLLSSALHWLREFHADGLRVDAVASMLYLDYGRQPGEWVANVHGGRENLGAIELIREINAAVRADCPGCLVIAEESTAWPGVTDPVEHGGLGFHFKWNMGWMHDTLDYFALDPIHRKHHQDQLTFAMVYENSERFLMPLSHDEVVHGKGSLLQKMAGDTWQKLANLRTLLAYMVTRPGKQLLFMGTEFASQAEWDHDRAIDWHMLEHPDRVGLQHFVACLGALYREEPCLWAGDPDPGGFRWVDCEDREQSVLSYLRLWEDRRVLVVLNLTPVPRDGYRIGVPGGRVWVQRLCSDDEAFGGSGYATVGEATVEPEAWHGQPASVRLDLPPLGALVLQPRE